MDKKIRLLYVSRIAKPEADVRDDLMLILSEALDFNSKNQIYGVLYYGHGFFLNCLEGERCSIESLYYNKIINDPRHCEVTLLYLDEIEQTNFSRWQMKYAPYCKVLMSFFGSREHPCFNPYLINEQNLPELLQLL